MLFFSNNGYEMYDIKMWAYCGTFPLVHSFPDPGDFPFISDSKQIEMTYSSFSASITLIDILNGWRLGETKALPVMFIHLLLTCRIRLFILADKTASHSVLEMLSACMFPMH